MFSSRPLLYMPVGADDEDAHPPGVKSRDLDVRARSQSPERLAFVPADLAYSDGRKRASTISSRPSLLSFDDVCITPLDVRGTAIGLDVLEKYMGKMVARKHGNAKSAKKYKRTRRDRHGGHADANIKYNDTRHDRPRNIAKKLRNKISANSRQFYTAIHHNDKDTDSDHELLGSPPSPTFPSAQHPFHLRHRGFRVRGNTVSARYTYFSPSEGIIYANTLDELVLGNHAVATAKTGDRNVDASGSATLLAGSSLSYSSKNSLNGVNTFTPAPPLITLLTQAQQQQQQQQQQQSQSINSLTNTTHTCAWWIDVQSPTVQEMKMLSRIFHIHPLTTEDILQSAPIPTTNSPLPSPISPPNSPNLPDDRMKGSSGYFELLSRTLKGRSKLEQLSSTTANFTSTSFDYQYYPKNLHSTPIHLQTDSSQDTREKVEVFSNYYFVCVKSFDQDALSETYLSPFNFYILVFPASAGIISVHFHPTLHSHNVLTRIGQLIDVIHFPENIPLVSSVLLTDNHSTLPIPLTSPMTTPLTTSTPLQPLIAAMSSFTLSTSWLTYAILDDIIDSYAPLLRTIEQEVDVIDDLVLVLRGRDQSDMLRRIGQARKRVMQLLRLLGTKVEVIKTLIKRVGVDKIGEDTTLYLGDIQDHLITMLQNLQYYDITLARSHSNYLAQISIEITQSSEAMNNIVAKLTISASAIVPLNIITGLWGMNVRVPGQGSESEVWFWCIVLAMVVLMCVLLFTIRRGGLF